MVMFLTITLLFLDFTGTIHRWLGWTAKVQFLPALLAMNVGVIVALILLTLLMGRVYCSVICPMGVMQDCISWISGKRKKKKLRFTYSREVKWLRYGVFTLFLAALIVGIGSFVALLAPYSSYGRIVSNLFAPFYQWGNNLLAFIAERVDSYAFYERDVWVRSIPTFIIAAITFVAIAILAWRNGRTYCNTICPVGTFLGFLSRFSMFAPVINVSKCVGCKRCARKCKASCIDSQNHAIDLSRCVACMDCIDTCHEGAIRLQYRWKSKGTTNQGIDQSRRSALTAVGILAAGAITKAEKKVDGGLAVIEDKKAPNRVNRIVPPGAISVRHFARHCTACQLCVSVCPNEVLRPSSDLESLMQPEMGYDHGYCRPECTRCSHVCPAGAILPITRAEKSSIQIGHAVWLMHNCIPVVDGVECGNCARHCPTGAIQMIPSVANDPSSVKIPAINVERCIGCGACENLCPARPVSAIYVEGNKVHSLM